MMNYAAYTALARNARAGGWAPLTEDRLVAYLDAAVDDPSLRLGLSQPPEHMRMANVREVAEAFNVDPSTARLASREAVSVADAAFVASDAD